MNCRRSLAIILALSCALALTWVLAVANPSGNTDDNLHIYQPEKPHSQSSPLRLFDFDRYRKRFRKSYSSFIERIVRHKLFLARAFRAFISAIKYKNNESTYYLKVNELSDYTEKEGEAMLNEALMDDLGEREEIDEIVEPMLDEQDLDANLRMRVNGEGRQMFEELERARERGNRKLSNTGPQSGISLADIEGTPDDGQESPEVLTKMKKIVASNNPSYEPPELYSYGAEEEEHPNEIVDKEYFQQVVYTQALDWIPCFSRKPQMIPNRPDDPDFVYVDHRKSHCFFRPRNQGKCASCYAFAMISYAEYLNCMETKVLVPFSEQYMIDCGARKKLKGCKGGIPYYAVKFILDYGVELRTNYPYRMRQDECPYSDDTSPKAMGYIKPRARRIGELELSRMNIEKLLKRTPIFIGISIAGDFNEYGGGVHSGARCNGTTNHGVLLMGHGRESGIEYWLIRNSYGTSWGENGYYRVAKNSRCLSKHIWIIGDVGFTRSKIALKPQKNKHNDPNVVKRHFTNLVDLATTIN